jgi:hypothetical protein
MAGMEPIVQKDANVILASNIALVSPISSVEKK